MTLRLHQLRALVGVVEHGGIRAASRHLHLSQAALTKSLRQLEEDAGVALIRRSPRGVVLTDAGQRLLARARLVTRQLDLADEELSHAADEQQGQIRVALTPYITLTHLGQVFSWFRQRYPKVSVELAEGLMSRVVPRLREGTLDLAVVAETGDLPAGEFNDRSILELEQSIAVRAGHPVLNNPTPAALAQLEWVLTGPRDGLKSAHLRAIFERAGVAPPQQIVYAETLTALAVMRHSDVAGIIPAPLLRLPECRGMVAVPPSALQVGTLTLKLLTRPDVPLMPATEYMAQCLEDVCKGQPSR